MAPQQNSTLIDDKLEQCPPLLDPTAEEIGHYSPILPLKNHNNYHHCRLVGNEPVGSNPRKGGETARRRSVIGGSRSISLHGVNSTVEQGNKEIPIWIQNEPRYVSGVTSKTTCNEIIKALIDDEIRTSNYASCLMVKRGAKDGAAGSRDYSDYVITESWRRVERAYDGYMAILPVWKAWSRVHNELRLTLKHKSQILDHQIPKEKSQKTLSSIRKYICKIFRFAIRTKKQQKDDQKQEAKKKFLFKNKDPIPDEILFVLMPDKLYDNRSAAKMPINSNIKPTSEQSAKLAEAKLLKERLFRLSETVSTTNSCSSNVKRRHRRSGDKFRKEKHRRNHQQQKRRSLDAKDIIKRRKDLVPIRHFLRNQIAQKTYEVDELFDREFLLTRELTSKCQQYKMENELYTNPEKQMEISIGKIQENIETYAKEIVKTERELLELKNEIKQDISIINNLKRLTIEAPMQSEETALSTKVTAREISCSPTVKCQAENKFAEQMQFVDNIYEFCDNNASMLV